MRPWIVSKAIGGWLGVSPNMSRVLYTRIHPLVYLLDISM